MSRLLRIARREYLAYVRTPGFWLSLLLLPLGLSTIVLAPLAMAGSAPTPGVAVVDFTGHGLEAAVGGALSASGRGAKPAALIVTPPGAPFADPASAVALLRPYISGSRRLPGGGSLDALIIVRQEGRSPAIDFWSRNVSVGGLQQMVRDSVARSLRRDRLAQLGVNRATLDEIDAAAPSISDFSPKAEHGKVGFKDRLPSLAGLGMGLLLWMVVLTGAGMLLNSVMEEKSTRILEVLLTSASVPEIMFGKILGVAAVTATILTFWMTIGGGLIAIRSPGLIGDIASVFLSNGRWAYFALYLVGGYLMFATLYVTIGAFCETSREAQTLLGPMMILMSVPLLFMSQAVSHPDAALLKTLTWVPLFTPFMMAARAGSDPPATEIALSALLMAAMIVLELWVAVPAFRSGALAGGRLDVRQSIANLFRRPPR